jgi:hypothetical protein
MNEEEGRTPIYFVMGLGDQFSHRVSTDSDDGKRAIVGYRIPKKAEPTMPLPDTTFFVIQLFDKSGYFTSIMGNSIEEVKEKVSKKVKFIGIACSLPFQGKWFGKIPDVSCPWPELSCLTGDSPDE